MALESLSPAFQVLLACCRHPLTEADRAYLEACLELPVDWNEFQSLIDRHRIHPQVQASLLKVRAGLVPPSVLEPLATQVRSQIQVTLKLSSDLLLILKALEEVTLPVIVLKGPPLSQMIFGDLALRVSHDLDLLVRPRDFERAQALLLTHGYQRVLPRGQLSTRQLQRLKKVTSDFSFLNSRGSLIELHHRPTHALGLFPDGEIAIWFESLQSLPFGGAVTPVLEPEALLTFLCVHGSLHLWFRLKWLCDIETLIKQEGLVDYRHFFPRIKALGLDGRVAEGMQLAHQLLKAPLTGVIEQFISEARTSNRAISMSAAELLDPSDPSRRKWELRRSILSKCREFLLRKEWKQKLRLCQEVLLIDEPILRIDLPGAFFPLYYFLRPILWLSRRIAASLPKIGFS